MRPLRIAILGSTRGSNLIPIAEAINHKTLNAEITIVISNKISAGILEKASNFKLNFAAIIPEKSEARADYDQRLANVLEGQELDLIVLIGFMRILSPEFINTFKNKIINVHPSLLPKHQGLMDLAVHQAVLDAQEKMSGCTVHLVTEIVDGGKILVQKQCEILENDTAETLKAKVQALEGPALIEAITLFQPKE
jgi:phosphoribosylglycinamide formyltransferase-1